MYRAISAGLPTETVTAVPKSLQETAMTAVPLSGAVAANGVMQGPEPDQGSYRRRHTHG